MGWQKKTIDTLAGRIREVYCQERNLWHHRHQGRLTDWGAAPVPRYDGGVDEMGRHWKNIWMEIAKFVITKKVDFAAFVRAQFTLASKRPVDPFHLHNDKAYSIYLSVAQRSSTRLSQLFAAQRKVFTKEVAKLSPCKISRRWSDEQVFRAVLGNRLIQLSALFRYCVARHERYEDLAEKYFQWAVEQYLDSPEDYDRIWGEWIPGDFRDGLKDLITRANYLGTEEEDRSPERVMSDPPKRTIIID